MNEKLNDTMQNAAAQLIEKAMSGLDQAAGFLQAEIPDYVYQLILWYGVKSGIYFVIGVALLSLIPLLYFAAIKDIKACKKNYEDGEDWTRMGFSGGVTSSSYDYKVTGMNFWLASIFLAIVGCEFINLQWLQIWIAPKVWLVEYASTLVK